MNNTLPLQLNISHSLTALLDTITESVVIVDLEGRILYANQITATHGDKTLEEIQGKLLWESFPAAAGEFYEEEFHRAVREQVRVVFEFYFPPNDKWLEVRFHPTPQTVTIFATDITERKRATEAVRVEQERLQNTLNAAGVGTWRWEFKTDRLVCDCLMRAFFDVSEDEADAADPAPYIAHIHPHDIAGLEVALSQSTATREKYARLYRTVHSDGSVHWLDARGQLEFDSEGNPVALIGTAIEVTAQKEAEEKYRRLFNSVDQGFCHAEVVFDSEGRAIDHRYLEVNPAFETITGLADAVGKSSREMIPGIEDWWHEKYAEVIRTGEPVRFQHGSEALGRIFDVFASAVGDSRVVILFTDITEKVQREKENRDLNIRLRRTVAETHHRVKNNLQVIAALVDMQTADIEDAVIAAPLHRINQHVKALAVIHDLLTQYAKEDADTEHIGTQAVLDTLVPLLQSTIGDRRITAQTDDVILTAQKAASFALLVSECVSNAVKHSSGEIDITLERNGNTAHLEICDDGTGFPPNFDSRTAANTGLQLIESAARWDLRGDVKYDNHGLGGGRVTVTFPVDANMG